MNQRIETSNAQNRTFTIQYNLSSFNLNNRSTSISRSLCSLLLCNNSFIRNSKIISLSFNLCSVRSRSNLNLSSFLLTALSSSARDKSQDSTLAAFAWIGGWFSLLASAGSEIWIRSGLDLTTLATAGTGFGSEFFGWSGRRPDLRGRSWGVAKGWWRACILVETENWCGREMES